MNNLSKQVDWSLYLVTDPVLGGGPDKVAEIVRQAVAGGVTVVQLRDKSADEELFLRRAQELQEILEDYPQVPLFINDRVNVAVKHGFHLHIGQHDDPYIEVRQALADNCMLGLSIEELGQLQTLETECKKAKVRLPEVVGIGPVWGTPTKTDAAQPLGVPGCELIARKARQMGMASVIIGGINQGTVFSLKNSAIDGICVVSAIMAAADPTLAAQELQKIIDSSDLC